MRGVPRARPGRWRLLGRVVLVVLSVAWVGAMVWLRPFGAVQPALAAMRSDADVTVTETATRIVLAPTAAGPSEVGVFFQPGARVDARAYAAVLRPLAQAGHPVVIAKQPLGIAFLALSAFDAARTDQPQVARWVVGGHSLGGTVAVIQADDADTDPTAPAVGLLLYASYPAGDVRASLTTAVESVSGSRDGLATPDEDRRLEGEPARRRDVHGHRGRHARAVRRLRPPARRRHRDDQRPRGAHPDQLGQPALRRPADPGPVTAATGAARDRRAAG